MKSAAKQTKNPFKARTKSFSSHFPTLQWFGAKKLPNDKHLFYRVYAKTVLEIERLRHAPRVAETQGKSEKFGAQPQSMSLRACWLPA